MCGGLSKCVKIIELIFSNGWIAGNFRLPILSGFFVSLDSLMKK